ncbi:MAG: cytochrome c [Proteobacteria bacterium]|nr:cytochrome c [Pseudomonadota bacterium]
MVAALISLPALAAADESQITLKKDRDRELVMGNCVMCHSLDYIQMNSPFMKKAAWQATVNKMVKVMGAPITPEDTVKIVDYLTRNYGVE